MKSFCLLTVLSLVSGMTGCGSTVPSEPMTPAAPAEPAERERDTPKAEGPRLIDRPTGLFVLDLPRVYHRGQFLYVLDKDPLAPGHAHERIGMVQVIEPNPLKVAWYCRPDARFVNLLRSGIALPVAAVKADYTIRIAKCWGHFLPQSDGEWRANDAVVDLTLNLGEGDGVVAGDIFEVLSTPQVDPNTLTVVSTELVGRCAVQDNEVSIDRSTCRLLKEEWPGFSREMWIRGGFVHQQQKRSPETRWIDLSRGGVWSTGGQAPECRVENGALVVTTQARRAGDFSMCCVDLLHAVDDLHAHPLGLAEVEVAKAERMDIKLEVADTDKQIFLSFQKKIDGRETLKKVFSATERAWKPNRVCIAGLDTVPNNTLKLVRIGMESSD